MKIPAFTIEISIANTKLTENRELLVGAIRCNTAWDLVDAAMYLIGILAHRNKYKLIFDSAYWKTSSKKLD